MFGYSNRAANFTVGEGVELSWTDCCMGSLLIEDDSKNVVKWVQGLASPPQKSGDNVNWTRLLLSNVKWCWPISQDNGMLK